MNFELNEDQLAYQQAAKDFAQGELAPNAALWDEEKIFPKSVIATAGSLGFCGMYSPEEYGGLNLSRLDTSIILEELAIGCTSTAAYISIHNMATWMLCTWGSEQLKGEWAETMVSGKHLGSYCLTEPSAGSDAASLRSTAKKSGDKYILNGSKMFISGAGDTDLLIVMARTDVNNPGPKGVSAFAVPAQTAGIHYGKNEIKMGWCSQPTRAISFEDVEIPEHCLLGNEGDGFKFAMKGLDGGRINIATCSIGVAQAAVNCAQKYMQEREQFGKPIASFQALQFKFADMVTELVAARQMVRLAAAKLDSQHPEATTYCAMAKRFATDIGFGICDSALQLHGGYGYLREYPLERFFRDARVHQILEGTNEIMRVITSRRILQDDGIEAIR